MIQFVDWETDNLGCSVSRSKVVAPNVENNYDDVNFLEIVNRPGAGGGGYLPST